VGGLEGAWRVQWDRGERCCRQSRPGAICGSVGRATTFVEGDVGSIPTGGALEVWPSGPKFGSRTDWLVNKSAGQPQLKSRPGPCWW
jgi:hypothetical protein